MTECYCVCIREMYNNPSLFSRAVEKLPWNDRKEKISGFVHNKDKYLCATAGVLLKYLFEINGIRDCTLLKNEYGKLYSKSCPELHFNLSHSGDYAVCVLSDSEIGADVEIIKNGDFQLARLFFTDKENEFLEKSEEFDRDFFRIWTLKESWLKRIGIGLSGSMKSFSVIPAQDNVDEGYAIYGTKAFDEERGNFANGVFFTEYSFDGHRVAVCSSEKCKLRINQLTLSHII